MKKLYRNIIVLVVAICFSAAGFIGEKTSAQTKTAAKSTPTPKSKKSPTAAAKATPKPTPNTKTAATPKATKTPVKSTSTTNAKISPVKSDKPSTKTAANSKPANVKPSTTAKPSPKPTSKPTATEQIIVTATASRIRQQPKANSAELSLVKLGKTLPVSEKNAAWYRVEYATGKSGWISKTFVKDYETDRRDEIYREIADKYSKSKT